MNLLIIQFLCILGHPLMASRRSVNIQINLKTTYRAHAARIVALASLSFIFSLTTARSSPPEKANEPPVVMIGVNSYNAHELSGKSLKQLQAEFDAEVQQLSDEQIQRQLRRYTSISQENNLANVPRREKEYALQGAAIKHLMDHTVKLRVLASITDNIIQTHKVKLDDYFNLAALQDTLDRQIAYVDFRYQNQKAPKERDRELFDIAVKEFRFARPFSYWEQTAEEFRQRPAFSKWEFEVLKHLHQEKILLSALLAHDLLKDACENPDGIYFQKGKNEFLLSHANLMIIDIHHYQGERKMLEELTAKLINTDETVQMNALHKLQTTLGKVSINTRVGYRNDFGKNLVNDTGKIRLGVLQETAPDHFRVIARVSPVTTDFNEDKGQALFYKMNAYRTAARAFTPLVRSLLPDWQLSLEAVTSALPSSNVQWIVSEVEVTPYIKYPYPENRFSE